MTEPNTAYEYPVSTTGLPKGTPLCNGQFTITRRLSAGGFGITYLAEDNTLGRTVVIKECFPDDICLRDGLKVIVRNAAQVDQFRSIVDMFMREARSVAKLRHPNIVGVHRAFEENDTAYMALDLIDGHDMLDIIEDTKAKPFKPARVKEILIQLLQAIETIHDHDLLHRDISPDNIIIEKSGTPVLIDFGAARGDASRRTRAISAMLVVKDGYSPQEFYLAGSVQTPASDIYALGATFYHVLTGEAPPNSQIRMAEIAGQNPDPCLPLAGRIDGYEPAFLEAIDLAMEIVPRNRLQSAAIWRGMISNDTSAPTETAAAITTAPAKETPDLDRLLTRLIAETNAEVKNSKPEAVKTKPKPALTPVKDEKPEWLDEFNRESLRKEAISNRFEVVPDAYETPDEVEAKILASKNGAERAVVNQTQRTKTRVIYATHAEPKPDSAWSVGEKEKKQQELEQYEQERQAVNEKFRAESRIKSAPRWTPMEDIDPFAEDFHKNHMIGPLAKYLITGFVIGLGIILIYPNFL